MGFAQYLGDGIDNSFICVDRSEFYGDNAHILKKKVFVKYQGGC
jgi:hypothetical protein